jgi:ribosomal protein L32
MHRRALFYNPEQQFANCVSRKCGTVRDRRGYRDFGQSMRMGRPMMRHFNPLLNTLSTSLCDETKTNHSLRSCTQTGGFELRHDSCASLGLAEEDRNPVRTALVARNKHEHGSSLNHSRQGSKIQSKKHGLQNNERPTEGRGASSKEDHWLHKGGSGHFQ